MTLSNSEADDIAATAHEMADAVRPVVLQHFRTSGLAAANKDEAGGFDPVTIADRAAEEALRDVLRRRRPDDGIIGEELGRSTGRSEITWVLDPIDGTRAFLCGIPVWGTLIAALHGGRPIFGVIDQPHIGERFIGGFGQAILQRGSDRFPLKTRMPVALSEARLLSTFPEVGTAEEQAAFHNVSRNVQLTRYGLDCYGYALLALGQVDLVIEAGLHIYDIAAPIAVIEAAGGIVTNWSGGPITDGGQVLAASSQVLHQHALELLRA